MESGEVDKSVGGEEEVRDEWGNCIQLGDNNTTQGNNESQNVAIHGLVVLAVTSSKGAQIRVELILAQGLENLWRRYQTGKCRTESGGKTSGVN